MVLNYMKVLDQPQKLSKLLVRMYRLTTVLR